VTDPICAVVGAGLGNGLAFARRFAEDGYRVALVGRSREKLGAVAAEVPGARAVPADAADPASLGEAFQTIRSEMGSVDVLLYNAGSGQWGNFQEITAKELEVGWRVNVLGLLVAGQAVAGDMIARGSGAIVVTGATAHPSAATSAPPPLPRPRPVKGRLRSRWPSTLGPWACTSGT
jgi:NADP-dependent 3-hydroxy acid dehydrogenase YdfG